MTAPSPFTAVLIAAHGDGGAARGNAAVRLHRERLAKRLELPVAYAVLKQPESFAAARAELGACADGLVAVYPMFMSDGYFVRIRLPAVLTATGFAAVRLLPALGLDPRLIDLIEARIRAAAAMQGGKAPADLRILLVAHGSATPETASRRAAEAIAADLRYRGLGPVHLGFIEEAPFVGEAMAAVDPHIVVGLFASEGTHAVDDVQTLVAERAGVLHHVTAIGLDLAVTELIASTIEHCISPQTA